MNKKDVWQKVEDERKSKHFYWGPWRRINVGHECCLSPESRPRLDHRSRDNATRPTDSYIEINIIEK